jgi:Zn-dependent M28 family amino/carboxypeptidase
MHCTQAIAFVCGTQMLVLAAGLFAAGPVRFSGESALESTKKIVALGPRPVDSLAHRKMQQMIVQQLQSYGCQVEQDVFTAKTPLGPKRMNNIIAKVAGTSGSLVAFSGHYDTKLFRDMTFVGANDGGASAGFLLELARVLCSRPSKHDVQIIWFDGEEALVNWTDEDSLYGSRRIARRWSADGTLRRLIGIFNVDMIGDRDLRILNDETSTASLRQLVWRTATELGYAQHFLTAPGSVTDDHHPFLAAGGRAVDIIDFDYGPENSYWHTERDTVDKLSAKSFQVVGDVLLQVLQKLER